MTKGILYIVWGDSIKPLLARSVESVHRFHPDINIHIEWVDGSKGLRHKTEMLRYSPFDLTLFLDADCTLLAPVDYLFDKAEKFGLVCTIAECPWLRWYGDKGDEIEYSTGVMAFSTVHPQTFLVMSEWTEDNGTNAKSRWKWNGEIRGLDYDDQASFSRVLSRRGINPFVVPNNWNFHPGIVWDKAFLPIKVWHSPHPVPDWVVASSAQIEQGKQPVEFAKICQ